MILFSKILVEVKGKIINITDLTPPDYDSFLDHVHALRKNKIERIFNTTIKNEKEIIQLYDCKEAPLGSKYLYHRIERNGVIDLSVPTYDLPKPGEKKVYFYQLP